MSPYHFVCCLGSGASPPSGLSVTIVMFKNTATRLVTITVLTPLPGQHMAHSAQLLACKSKAPLGTPALKVPAKTACKQRHSQSSTATKHITRRQLQRWLPGHADMRNKHVQNHLVQNCAAHKKF